MNLSPTQRFRLQFLATVAGKELHSLQGSANRLFRQPLTIEHLQRLIADEEQAERIEAFASRFGRLQDTLGDKLIPSLLSALAEPTGAAADNLDRAERLGWLPSTEQWLDMRQLRNRLVHEYIADTQSLHQALLAAQAFVPVLTSVVTSLQNEMHKRGWIT